MFQFRQLFVGLLLFSFQFAQARSHIRFWKGFKQDAISMAQFKENVSQNLVPATVTVGKDQGLESYLPVFTGALPQKPDFIPDEIAIIQYTDESTYKTLAATPAFSAYGKMHYQDGYFVKTNQAGFTSGSLVSIPLAPQDSINLTKPQVVDFGDVDGTWKNDSVQLSVILLSGTDVEKNACVENLVAELKTAIQSNQMSGFIFAYDPKYILVYKKNQNPLLNLPSRETCMSEQVIQLKNKSQFYQNDLGINFKF